MLGGFDPFLHTVVGGLDSAISGTSAGWEHIRVRVSPAVMARVHGHAVSSEHASRFGTTSLRWQFTDDDGQQQLSMQLVVPVGSTAEVHSPASVAGRELAGLAEGGEELWLAEGATARPSTAEVAGDGDEQEQQPPPPPLLPEGVRGVKAQEGAVVTTVGSGAYAFTARYV